MKNKALALFVAAVLGFAFVSNAVMAQDKPAEKKEVSCAVKADQDCCKQAMVCPVSGKPGNKEIFSEFKGQKVFFCCKDAKEAFDKDPAKYEANIHKCSDACKKECEGSCCKADKKKECKESSKNEEKPAEK